ncbi:MAG: 4-hydroxythreonine-4-phosphate dehydrogenase PdxA [Gammaproteobacteria bacterium]|nr:4-hydroxythreonine-4-phosphate dehydrogenase PdxA [Gammaproteobacteria bacterium]MDH5630935.1 4-hydroxythreonine-4-phosphate dehydrogenase PdxA [Gammaproteobacteria bacterium]
MSKKTQDCPRVLLTMGEAAGIGPELLVKLAQGQFNAQLVVLADGQHLKHIADVLGVPLQLTAIEWDKPNWRHQSGHLFIEEHKLEQPVVKGELNVENANTTLSILQRASELALDKKVDCIVTAPVHKANLNRVCFEFTGHTEYFASLAKVKKVVMMLATDDLRITLATTHLPLKLVPGAITKESLTSVIDIIYSSFRFFGIESPKLAVCGLNPHAGDSGLLGREEIDVIEPVVNAFREKGFDIEGPLSADTLFTPINRMNYDVFLAMYHDQGLPVIKTIGFGRCVNVTLGLPYIRTSVDHGTALDIAAKYCANPDSLVCATDYAIALTQKRLPD